MTSNAKRVLVAEDNSAMADVIRFNLERAGFRVAVARSGHIAWEMLKAGHFDLLISDFQMPGITGGELCERTRKVPRMAAMPVILLTAKSLELDAAKYTDELGVRAIVSKPFSPRQLTRLVEDCLVECPAET